MSPEEYLQQKLKTCSQYQLTDDDLHNIKSQGLRLFLYKQITRKKFRRWKLPEVAKGYIDRALDACIQNNKPLHVRFRFGGYKLWRLASAPEVDWAEFFALAHYAAYLAPIVAAYQPGVKLLFMSDDMFVEGMDNVPKEDTERYYRSFNSLVVEFQKYFPKNLSFRMIRHSSLYPSEEAWRKEYEEKIHEIEPTWKDQIPPEKLKSMLATSALNMKWDGVRDLTVLSDEEKKKYIERGALMHEALVKVPTIRAFSDKNNEMFSISCGPLPSVVSIGTTKSSITKFWVGTGVLEEREGVLYDRILSPNQIGSMQKIPVREMPVRLIPLKNFESIDIYKEGFDFKN